jgi:hypothetical protein
MHIRNHYFAGLLIFCCFNGNAADFESYPLSKQYSAKIHINQCDGKACAGAASVDLLNIQTNKIVQQFKTDELNIMIAGLKNSQSNSNHLDKDQSIVIVDDFNFDGREDVAIQNGNDGSYGSPSYDVYVYNQTKKMFVPSAELSALASDTVGLFSVDHKRKRIITFEKDGCCWHLTSEYAVIPKKGLQKVNTKEEAIESDGNNVKVIINNWQKNSWHKTTHVYKTDEYYK